MVFRRTIYLLNYIMLKHFTSAWTEQTQKRGIFVTIESLCSIISQTFEPNY